METHFRAYLKVSNARLQTLHVEIYNHVAHRDAAAIADDIISRGQLGTPGLVNASPQFSQCMCVCVSGGDSQTGMSYE